MIHESSLTYIRCHPRDNFSPQVKNSVLQLIEIEDAFIVIRVQPAQASMHVLLDEDLHSREALVSHDVDGYVCGVCTCDCESRWGGRATDKRSTSTRKVEIDDKSQLLCMDY